MGLVTAVLPVLDKRLGVLTLESMCPAFRAATLVVDNTQRNRGVSASWNRGIDRMRERDDDWVVLVSTATTFGTAGGQDLLDELAGSDQSRLVSVVNAGWHLQAIPRAFLDLVGPFDEGFFAYYEDTDWLHRMTLAGFDVWRGEGNRHVYVESSYLPDGHSKQAGLITPEEYEPSAGKYLAKWGGHNQSEVFATPFDRPGVDWTWLWADELACDSG